MKVLAWLPAVAAVATTTTGDRIASMQTTLRNIAIQAAAKGKIDPGTKTAVQGFMNTMNRTLVQALIEETKANQKILDDALAAIEKCATDRTDTFAGDVSGKATTRDDSRSALATSKTCGEPCSTATANGGRGAALLQGQVPTGHNYSYDVFFHWNNKSVPLSTLDNDEMHKKALAQSTCDSSVCRGECDCHDKMKTKCDQLDEMVAGFVGPTEKEPDFCDTDDYPQRTKPDTHPHTSSIDSRDYYSWEAQAQASDPVYIWFEKMESFVDAHVANYKTCRENCHLLRWVHQHRMFESHKLQRSFERDFCAWAHSIDVACFDYAQCYDRTYKLWASYNSTIATEEIQFKAQQTALECALCYGAQILADSTDLSACDGDRECKNCDVLCINYVPPHEEIPCDEEAKVRPCDAAWATAEYGCWAATCPPDDCIPCSETKPDI